MKSADSPTLPTVEDLPALAGLTLDIKTHAEINDADLLKALRAVPTAYRAWIAKERARIGDPTEACFPSLRLVGRNLPRAFSGAELGAALEAAAFQERRLRDLSTVELVWPLDQSQRRDRGRHGTLHAKCVLVDSHRLFASNKPGKPCSEVFAENSEYMRSRGMPVDKRLYSHGQDYDLVERPLIRQDEDMLIDENMVFACHPGYTNERVYSGICNNFLIGPGGKIERLHKMPQEIFELT